jgi:VanZ family protein
MLPGCDDRFAEVFGLLKESRRWFDRAVSNGQRFLRLWLPLLAWMALIFLGSTDVLAGRHTSRFLGPFLHWLVPGLADETLAAIQLFVRKVGHLTEYAVLAVLWLRLLRSRQSAAAPWNPRLAAWAIALSALYAATDEWHQSFVASRQGSPWDVLIDSAGAALGVALAWAVGRWRRRG